MKKKARVRPAKKNQVPNLISPNAKLGKNVRVWNFAYVGSDTVIGDNTKIGSLAHIDYGVKIGRDCKIEGMAYVPPLSRIGNNVFIGPAAVLTNDPYPLSDKMIGVTVEDGAIICARAVIKAGVTVGKNSVVGMGSVVTKDVPPESVVVGSPAKQIYSRSEYEAKRLAWNKRVPASST
ncbi:MAG: N-acetyltransferase [Nitrososphaerota archaeon]|nr:N-acetyltransferase [Nitrososphaerota archaeon]